MYKPTDWQEPGVFTETQLKILDKFCKIYDIDVLELYDLVADHLNDSFYYCDACGGMFPKSGAQCNCPPENTFLSQLAQVEHV